MMIQTPNPLLGTLASFLAVLVLGQAPASRKSDPPKPEKTGVRAPKKAPQGKDPKKPQVKPGGKPASRPAEKPAKGDVRIGVETKEAETDAEVEIPPGATEDDIRAIRGANLMLEVERNFTKILSKLKVKNAQLLRIDDLEDWTYEDGLKGLPERLRKLDGKRVVIPGFMLPIDDVEDIRTFYLVRSLWSCCYGAPPDINGLVRIEMQPKKGQKKAKGVDYYWDPIFVAGTFRLRKVMDEDYCVCIFVLEAETVRVLDVK